MAPVVGRIEVDVRGIPEVLAGMRHEFAQMLRRVAEDEDAGVAARLRELAAAFEAGQVDVDGGS